MLVDTPRLGGAITKINVSVRLIPTYPAYLAPLLKLNFWGTCGVQTRYDVI